MTLTIVNLSTSISPSSFLAAVAAINRQVGEDFKPEWNVGVSLRSATLKNFLGKAPIPGLHFAIIYVGDSSSDPTTGIDGALGYHSVNHSGIPYGFVYLDVVRQYGEQWTVTLSHEVLELLADPSAVLAVAGPDPKNPSHTVQYDLEVADPTQGDAYEIDGVEVSNFVNRAWFGMPGGASTTNYLGLPLESFQVRPQGYFQYESAGVAHQVLGEGVSKSEWTKSRALMKLARRNARRANRLK